MPCGVRELCDMFNAHAAGCNQRGKSLHFFVVQLKEAIVRLVAAVYILCFECGIYILYQERRVKGDRRKFCVIDVPRQYENLRLSQE